MKRTAFALALLLGVGAVALVGQHREPLLDGKGYVREDAYLTTPLPPSERAYATIEGGKMKAIRDFSSGSRTAGSCAI